MIYVRKMAVLAGAYAKYAIHNPHCAIRFFLFSAVVLSSEIRIRHAARKKRGASVVANSFV